MGQLPAGASQSRTLFVRNVDPSVPEDELRTLFEVRPCVRGRALLWRFVVGGHTGQQRLAICCVAHFRGRLADRPAQF